jgi:hypothetical protein
MIDRMGVSQCKGTGKNPFAREACFRESGPHKHVQYRCGIRRGRTRTPREPWRQFPAATVWCAGRRCGRDLLVRAYRGAQLAPGILAQAQINFVVLDMRQHATIGLHQHRRVRAAQCHCIIVSDVNLHIDCRRGGGLLCQMTTVQIVPRPRLSGLKRNLRVR